MKNSVPCGVVLTPLKIIPQPQGDVLQALKKSDRGFAGFGEAYFSSVLHGEVKGWKRHRRMTLNLVVPSGEIRFVLYDDRDDSSCKFYEVLLSRQNYYRLTVPPGIWLAFAGCSEDLNLLLNLASIEHDPTESDNRPLEEIAFDWSIQS